MPITAVSSAPRRGKPWCREMRAGPGKPEKRDETMVGDAGPAGPCMRPIWGKPGAGDDALGRRRPRRMEPAPPEAPLIVASLAE